MKLAVIFWCYKYPEICRNRLQILREYNPDIKIFGLYGGDRKNAKQFKQKIGEYFDDWYVSSLCSKPRNFKWIHGDVMLLDWYTHRGKNLAWDSVVIVQWDMLVFDSLKKQFPRIKKDQIFLSGFRKLEPKVEKSWHWTRPDRPERKNYLAFRDYVKQQYNYSPNLFWCCLFILEIIPRKFFTKWQTVPDKLIGMLEYKIPTYADIFNIPIYRNKLGVLWDIGMWQRNKGAMSGRIPMNARGIEVQKDYIEKELKKPKGFRIFHPYNKIWK
jgi:hypothetical protein